MQRWILPLLCMVRIRTERLCHNVEQINEIILPPENYVPSMYS